MTLESLGTSSQEEEGDVTMFKIVTLTLVFLITVILYSRACRIIRVTSSTTVDLHMHYLFRSELPVIPLCLLSRWYPQREQTTSKNTSYPKNK